MKLKPILFNSEMVKAILKNRKIVTRRAIKNIEIIVENNMVSIYKINKDREVQGEPTFNAPFNINTKRWLVKEYAPYKVGDILYVRETGMIQSMKNFGKKVKMLFKADNSLVEFSVSDEEYERLSKWELLKRWLSPYWLTKETARIFLKVIDVRFERLQDITIRDIEREGLYCEPPYTKEHYAYATGMRIHWTKLWNSTIKKQDLDQYGWEANPWVWVIEFKKVTN